MKKHAIALLILVGVLLLTSCQTTPAPTAAPTEPLVATEAPTEVPTEEPGEPVLTLEGLTETKTFTLAELKALPSAEGQAGFISSTGKITTPRLYKGVLLTELARLVGADSSEMGIQLIASDGYSMTFSYDQVANGDFITYDPATGDEIADVGALQAILAYEVDGQPLDAERDGILRLMVISKENNQVVDGHWSVKFVETMSIKPLVEDWVLTLEGAITDTIDRGSYESCSTGSCHPATWTDDSAQTWAGTPLYILVGRVDDENKHDDGAFNKDLADAGYTVDIIASDGYTVTLDSTRIKNNMNLLVAYAVNENPLVDDNFPLKLVGADLTKKEMVGAIEKIVVHLPAPVEADLTLTGLVDAAQAWTWDDLEALEVVKLTVEHPKKGAMEVEGVRLNALLDLAGVKPEAKTLVITASDDFFAEVDLAAVRACVDCLIYFDEDMLRTAMPGMESNFWVKDVVKLEVK